MVVFNRPENKESWLAATRDLGRSLWKVLWRLPITKASSGHEIRKTAEYCYRAAGLGLKPRAC